MKKRAALLFFVMVLILLACNVPAPLGQIFATRTPLPSATPIPSQTPLPTLTPTIEPAALLIEKKVAEENRKDHYTIKALYPSLNGPSSQVGEFNRQVTGFIESSIEQFRQNAAQANGFPGSDTGSYFETTYQTLYNQAGLLSVQIQSNFYINGAAHPGSHFTTFTYDLRGACMLSLADLFLPGAAYLETIANICKAELDQRNIAAWTEGADPKVENYLAWGITPQGLQIVFDEYQVAAYAAGPQTVAIPYDRLKTILNPAGPINRFQK
jgi:hypothetical protein